MSSTQLAPIVLFVFRRPEHTRKTLEALAKNTLAKESILYIYADGAKDEADENTLRQIDQTRAILKEKQWCKEVHIHESSTNKGLADSILNGVTEIVNQYGKIIVLEDDIVTSPYFLQYMNDALDMYEQTDKVMHISGFVPKMKYNKDLPETYFLRFMSCWGWATWKRAWDKIILDTEYLYNTIPARKDSNSFNLDGAIDIYSQVVANYKGSLKTWAFKWYSTIFLENGLCLYPKKTLVDNIGIDGSGENSGDEKNLYKVELAEQINVHSIIIEESRVGKQYLQQFYFYGNNPTFRNKLIFGVRSLYYKLKRIF